MINAETESLNHSKEAQRGSGHEELEEQSVHWKFRDGWSGQDCNSYVFTQTVTL